MLFIFIYFYSKNNNFIFRIVSSESIIMDILATPDVYQPAMDTNGNYVDRIPSFQFLNNGLRCPCGNHEGYKHANAFRQHINTQRHASWINHLNQNRHNIYAECEDLKKVVEQQRQQIIDKERIIRERDCTIRVLTYNLNEKIDSQLNNQISDLMLLD